MEAGLDRVLTKPVLERSLKDMLRIALARKLPEYPLNPPPDAPDPPT